MLEPYPQNRTLSTLQNSDQGCGRNDIGVVRWRGLCRDISHINTANNTYLSIQTLDTTVLRGRRDSSLLHGLGLKSTATEDAVNVSVSYNDLIEMSKLEASEGCFIQLPIGISIKQL